MITQKQVFLSYASEDLEKIQNLYRALEARNVSVWFDKIDLGPGRWKPQIRRAIARSSYFVICLSLAALRKTGDEPGFQDEELNTAFEIALAQDEHLFTIIPVRLENVERGDNRLSVYQQYDLFEDWHGTLDKLAVLFGGTPHGVDTTVTIDKANEEQTEEEKTLRALHGKAAAFYVAGYYEKAIKILDAIEEIEGETVETLNDKGATLHALGNFELALSTFDQVLSIEPNAAVTWHNKGKTLDDLKFHDEALVALDKAISISPSPDMWFDKGKVLLELDEPDESLRALDKALSLQPDFARAHAARAIVLNLRGRHQESLAAAEAALGIQPDLAQAQLEKGRSLSALGNYDQAILALDKAIALDPSHIENHYVRGCVLLFAGANKQALKVFDALLTTDPNNFEYHMLRYAALVRAKCYEEAVAEMSIALSLNPNDGVVWYENGILMTILGNYKEAVTSYKQALIIYEKILKTDPDDLSAQEFKKNTMERLKYLK